jgi:hypothetical protein
MDDDAVLQHIGALVDEEHRLERSHVGEPLAPAELERMRAIEVQLDQCWDLLRQRQARKSAGLDPDGAAARPEGVVEGYEQ